MSSLFRKSAPVLAVVCFCVPAYRFLRNKSNIAVIPRPAPDQTQLLHATSAAHWSYFAANFPAHHFHLGPRTSNYSTIDTTALTTEFSREMWSQFMAWRMKHSWTASLLYLPSSSEGTKDFEARRAPNEAVVSFGNCVYWCSAAEIKPRWVGDEQFVSFRLGVGLRYEDKPKLRNAVRSWLSAVLFRSMLEDAANSIAAKHCLPPGDQEK
eukprot:gnl/Spiro4/15187_TR8179_c0_g1_i1.p1 gnl/Spiro4/15187_TR8179_c0_g1~~gnl/Spiro4/15187_TR8179_c0_g1_i1.p1  ORF type:complete len:222 (-),score=36.77 gnl/Spiro4/15187_TR8179_c0_g1_i1:466-1095(-)